MLNSIEKGNTFAIASEVLPRRHRGTGQIINQSGSNFGLSDSTIGAPFPKSHIAV
jgi:hypothetical protein